jgi:hypothetical protein
LPWSLCSDPQARFYPQREVCFATMEREAANAAYERLHEARKWHDGTFTRWAEHPSALFPYRFDFGVTVGVAETDLRPGDLFTTQESAPFPVPPQGESDAEDDGGDDEDPEDQ